MKQKGFTLIELLAVIVILAIIALIATPIVLNIIDGTRKSSTEQSTNMYGTAVENGIAKKLLNHSSYQIQEGNYIWDEENRCLKIESSTECIIDVEYDGAVPSVDTVTIKSDGSIYFKATLDDGTKYTYGTPIPVCKLTKDIAYGNDNTVGTIGVGDMVTCGTESFYVIPNDTTAHPESAVDGMISMLAALNIEVSTDKPLQSSSAISVSFSNSAYWDIYLPDGIFIYNSNASIFQYVNAYKETLIGIGLSSDITTTLISYNQLTSSELGCNGYEFCLGPDWVYSTTYWTGSIYSNEVWTVWNSGAFESESFGRSLGGVRPVVIIDKSEIEV